MSFYKTSAKHSMDGINFMSEGELAMYKELKKTNLQFEYQPEKLEIIPGFKSTSGKTYKAMNYEPDFLVTIGKTKFYLEIKGQNDNIYIYRKGQKPQIKNNSELYRLKHKVIDHWVTWNADTDNDQVFMVVRHSMLKTPEYAGLFFEKDFEQMKKFKTQKNKERCGQVPRIIERLLLECDLNLESYGDY